MDRTFYLTLVSPDVTGLKMPAPMRNILTPEEMTYCFEDDDVEIARLTMREKNVKRLLVLNAAKRLIGIISSADIESADNPLNSGDSLQPPERMRAPLERRKNSIQYLAPERRRHWNTRHV